MNFLLLQPKILLQQPHVLLIELNILLLEQNIFAVPILTNDFVGITKPFFSVLLFNMQGAVDIIVSNK